ncbi:MAG TPA: cell division protein FtsL [Bacillus sp. (in: firmicutes)]|uniref:cell division protein FtsL n=1 Tax=Bacillus litorisediminis TaxID=2922713 RepID=UPI001FAB6426|nr:cell division protein FtsL [Bacillus litorisediminis]HWO77856.1 cell division protein FtsL [Bacillus sp. (in: firmicutes)]
MSNLARKLQQQQQIHVQPQPKHQPSKKIRPGKLTPVEKILGLVFALFLTVLSAQLIASSAGLYQINKDIGQLESEIIQQERKNQDLENQVSELSRYERIMEKAKELGLKLDENNVKLVEGH